MKILPIRDPLIYGRMTYGIPLSIISAYDSLFPWFYSMYIDIYMDTPELFTLENARIISGAYKPVIDHETITRDEFFDLNLSIIDFLQKAIDSNQYVYAFFNKYYVPGTQAYKNKNHNHNLFIYGYDSHRSTFNVMTFDNSLKFNNIVVSYTDIEYAFLNYSDPDPILNNIYSMTFKKKKYHYELSSIINKLEKYLSPIETYSGLNSYQFIQQNLVGFLNKKSNYSPSLVNYHVLYEHKLCMFLRAKFFEENKLIAPDIINECHTIVQNTLITRNMLMKYHINKNDYLIEKMITLLGLIKEEEQKLLHKMIIELNKKRGHIFEST
ncbi:hypothetical protein BVG16_07660 [Paenibacillus selenitireducens]|uniref:Butirosin biosynthesis protein H N-terminal domain-containing protein n=1 Tax=Paenibacillus selenitireducens TaxID=1324314 RepID=A0A1T2XLH8_9BACL|nr:hypothetical protein [Paenibacillus selenitireducens]OPA80586.1 hypothetical protein BVG16_07660 [Paenibacillus selenitireducens]